MIEHDLLNQKIINSFDALLHNRSFLFQVMELFPIPIEIFTPDGTSVFVNQAFLECFRISESTEIVGKLNTLKDPYLNGKLGLSEYLQRVFSGEVLSLYDIRVPFEEFDVRYTPKQSRITGNVIYQDITSFPLWDENRAIAYVVTLFMTKHTYQARLDTIKAKEYIETNWIDDFDIDKLTDAVSLSRYHLVRLFRQDTGKTPYSYYQDIKIGKIKDALCDTSLTISEAFTSCGADYSSSLARAFKSKVGMTPSQYRQAMTDKACVDVDEQTRARIGSAVNSQDDSATFFPPSFSENMELLYQVLEWFPFPINVFTPDGNVVFANRTALEMWNIFEPAQIVGKYNLIKDTVVNERLGLGEYVRRTIKGEIVLVPDVRVPLEDFSVWYEARNIRYDIESMYTDILNFPICDRNGRFAHFMCVFLTTRIYQGKSDVARAKEYIENHWLEEFDIDKVAGTVHLSRSHLARLFKLHIGITPYSYYQKLKITRIKEALRDKNLSVSGAFASCGIEYHGNFAKLFKEKVGMTPSMYKKTLGK